MGLYDPDPLQQQAVQMLQAQPQQQGNALDRAMMSPYAAMAGAGLQNIASLRRDRGNVTNPVAAYQQSVAQNAALRQKRQQLDPYFDYEEGKRRGHIPETMTYPEFKMMGLRGVDPSSPMKNLAQRRALKSRIEAAETPEEKAAAEEELAAFETYVRAPMSYSGGGGSQYVYDPASGRNVPLVTAETATGREAAKAGAVEGAEQQVETNFDLMDKGMELAWDAEETANAARRMQETTQAWLDKFESGTAPKTGFKEALLLDIFGIGSEKLGEMSAETIRQGLANLGIANLAPVTENEFERVMGIWANVAKSPEVNKGSLKNALEETKRIIRRANRRATRGGLMIREYGGEEAFNRYMKTNEYLQSVLGNEEDDPEVDF